VQKEAYWLAVPCITLRDETEWVETVETGWNSLAGTDPARIQKLAISFAPPSNHPNLYGDGQTSTRIIKLLE
jgi:UDP-GlcNAc3NAcA epimerase